MRRQQRREWEMLGYDRDRMLSLWDECDRLTRKLARALGVTQRSARNYVHELDLPARDSKLPGIVLGRSKYVLMWEERFGDRKLPPTLGEFAKILGVEMHAVASSMYYRRRTITRYLRTLPGIEGTMFLFTTREGLRVPGVAIESTSVKMVGYKERVKVTAFLKSGTSCTMTFKLKDYLEIISTRR